MSDQINSPQDPNQDSFVKKQIEQPILDQQTKSKVAPGIAPAQSSGGWFKEFYLSNKLYIWAIVAGLLLIGILSFFAFRKAPAVQPKEANINISVDAPTTAPSGGELVYKINIENKDTQKIAGAELELVYPEGVTYISSTPQKALNLSGTRFAVPELLSNDKVAIIVKTRIAGGVNDMKSLVMKLHYRYANFNSDFEKDFTYDVRLVASDILFELDGPTNTNNAQLVTYTLHYKNNSSQEIKNAQAKINFPDNFTVAQTNPEPNTGSNMWNITSLPVGSEGTITFSGTYNSAGPGDTKTVSADLLVLGSNGQPYVQTSTQFPTTIASVPLLASQELQNNNNHGVVDPGDNLTFTIRYQNNSSVVATGVNILVTLDSKALDLGSISAEGGQVNNNSILWNASTVPALESLTPSGNGSVQFTVRVKDPATRDSSTSLTIASHVKIKSNEYPDGYGGQDVSLKVSSTASISTKLDFSSGSLPPKVGTQTSYKVTLSLKNATNDFSNGVVTAYIPLGPSGFDISSVPSGQASQVTYDSSTGKLTWNVGALSAHTGDFKPAKTLQFTVKVNPAKNQVGQSVTLVKDITFTATDTFTEQNINLTAEDLSTNDTTGQFGSQGIVEP